MDYIKLLAVAFGSNTFSYFYFEEFGLRQRNHDGTIIRTTDERLKEAIIDENFFALNLTAESTEEANKSFQNLVEKRLENGIFTPAIIDDIPSMKWLNAMSALDLLEWEREKIKIKNGK